MEVPVRGALPLRLRGRAGPLLFAAARVSGEASGAIYGGRHPAGIRHRKGLRAAMHRGLRALHLIYGFLAGSADDSRSGRGATGQTEARATADAIASFPSPGLIPPSFRRSAVGRIPRSGSSTNR